MGLDILAWGSATLLPPHEVDWDGVCGDEGHERAYVLAGFEQSFRGLEADRCYRVEGAPIGFRAGSYGSYGEWRRALCWTVLGVDPEDVWESPDTWRARPFFELINFADNEGMIGSEAARDLAADFREWRERVFDATERRDRPFDEEDWDASAARDWFRGQYDQWRLAFELASAGGMVMFG